jgi:hypothetical protein
MTRHAKPARRLRFLPLFSNAAFFDSLRKNSKQKEKHIQVHVNPGILTV